MFFTSTGGSLIEPLFDPHCIRHSPSSPGTYEISLFYPCYVMIPCLDTVFIDVQAQKVITKQCIADRYNDFAVYVVLVAEACLAVAAVIVNSVLCSPRTE